MRPLARALALALPLFALASSPLAHAQDLGPGPVIAVAAPAADAPSVATTAPAQAADPIALGQKAFEAVQLKDWQMLAAAALGFLALLARRYTAPWHFFQTKSGAAFLVGSLAAISTLIPVLESHAFTILSLASAVLTGLTSTLALLDPRPAPIVKAALALLIPSLIFAGCACWQASNPKYTSNQCVIARGVVDCTKNAVLAEKDRAIGVVLDLIAKGTTDVAGLLAGLKEMGFSEGECLLAFFNHQYLTAPQALYAKALGSISPLAQVQLPSRAAAVAGNFDAYVLAKYGKRVTYKF